MYIALWILLCLLASIGAVGALSWLICALARLPGTEHRAYQVIPLEHEAGALESQLRYELHLLRWSSAPRLGPLVLLDTGITPEAREVLRNLLLNTQAIVCTPQELEGLLLSGAVISAPLHLDRSV